MKIDICNLKNEINLLKLQFYNAQTKQERIIIYESLTSLCDTYNLLSDFELQSEFLFLKTHKDFKKYYRFLFYDHSLPRKMKPYYNLTSKNIMKIYRDTDFKSFFNKPSTNLNSNDAMNLILDFFIQFDERYYEFIKSMFDNNQVEILHDMKNNLEGICFDVYALKKSYVMCDIKNYNISNLASLVHELGHAIYNDINVLSKFPRNYIEVPSMYFMKLFLDYTLEKKIDINDTMNGYNLYYRRILKYFAGLCLNTESLKNNNRNSNQIYNYILTALKQSKSESINSSEHYNFIYSYGSLIALYFADQYKNDPEIGKINFNNYMLEIGNKTDQELINTCGLNEEELVNPQVLKKGLLNNMLKK